ncbi:TPA: hypothetical protein N0J62_004561 [Salmonella enterica subsp. enterica serovar Enteritidis]|uniref:Uncharacterized protein n=1 Tax=Salmonella enteritidis TaxID=149539 RepID=A0A626EJW2_SALEN|nr:MULTISPECIES: hypothetical protein [Enterobacteriaceae]EAA5366826.1 hypothetical protein [Salmonella enterica subsp. enterica serovar Enteritidis]EAM9063031.1 hypothetical protein [Salmonella enterica]EBS3888542.1 hypothetical protein [Salmonella enterica subsp. enterica serovar Newport]ECT0182518.1 hypothetical protein [Salmonella enterica subsp. enterica serovar Infantis]EDN4701412.1 hypothetical protein [Salmonella enterica subsp. enterica serovar 6,7:-:1,5]EEA2425868.1 hypothetical pro
MGMKMIFKRFAKGCAFIAIGSITAPYHLIYAQINPDVFARLYNINKKEVEQFNDWFLSWNNPFIHFSLFFGVWSLIFCLLYVASNKAKRID